MSFSDRTHRLEQSFRSTATLLREMLEGLKARRVAWGSVRPKALEPSPELERLAQQLAGEEELRVQLLRELRRMLPAPAGADAASMHVNVTRIAAAMPTAAAQSLRAAADEATQLAKAVRVEVTLGQRLLQFTQRAQDSLLAGIHGATNGPAVYDRHARADRRARAAGGGGALVDGRI